MAKAINKINKKENKFYISISKGGFVKDLQTGKFLNGKEIELQSEHSYLIRLGNCQPVETINFTAAQVEAAEAAAKAWARR